jgi:hypothetical protein
MHGGLLEIQANNVGPQKTWTSRCNDVLHPLLSVVVGVRATSLTRFIENTCNICISK